MDTGSNLTTALTRAVSRRPGTRRGSGFHTAGRCSWTSTNSSRGSTSSRQHCSSLHETANASPPRPVNSRTRPKACNRSSVNSRCHEKREQIERVLLRTPGPEE
jgi:hypothetical protein